MKKQFTLHLYHNEFYGKGTDAFTVFCSGNMADNHTTYVRPVEVEVDIPEDFDLRAAKLAQLEAEQVKVRAAFQARITEIQREIAKLQALEMEVAQ